jgi:acyl-CoA synthetase (NDP forming)
VDLTSLLDPRSVAIVGASERPGSYGGETLVNLAAIGYEGDVWGVNPGRTRVHGRECFPSLAELPAVPDAVVVAVPAASVPEVIEEAGRIGSGGAVVYAAGLGEVAAGLGLQRELVEAARRHDLPVCGPNGNGIVCFPRRVALWGDALVPSEPGEVALISQSGNLAVNALAARRGLRLHTVISSGNQAVLDAADWLLALAREEGVRSVALNLEDDGDGGRLCEALAACADAGIGVAVLKVGASEAGASAAAAHTGAVASDQRVFRALIDEAGGASATDPHDLLELAKALATRRPARRAGPARGGLAVMTCSGGDSSAAGDEAERLEIELAAFSPPTEHRLRELLPAAATVGNPLDYTSMIWGERDTLRELIETVGRDPHVARLLIFYDEPEGLEGGPKLSWDAVREGIIDGAAASPVPVIVASTLPELLQVASATRLIKAGVPAIAGLRTALLCAAALMRPRGVPSRLREIAALAVRSGARAAAGDGQAGAWLAEHEAKGVLREAGVPVVAGRVARGEDDAVAILEELGPPVVAKLTDPGLRHKSELGALALDLATETELRAADARLRALGAGEVLVERHAPPGAQLLIAARRDAVVPSLAVGLGGIWTEALDDAAVIPLPATPSRVELALRGLRGAPLLTGGRGGPELDVAAAARLAAAAGELLVKANLELLELNPVVVHERGAVVVDALARRTAG